MKKAVVLLSGGMDSAVTLYIAREKYEVHVLIFDYGQKSAKEIACARKLAEASSVAFRVLKVSFPWKGSALLDDSMEIPGGGISAGEKIPSTYVPARNIVFLSFGVSFAETIGAETVFIGAHEMDFSNYPDCRSGFFSSFQLAIDKGTKQGVEGKGIKIETPIIGFTKKDIVETGVKLGVPFEHTWSCYKNGERPCGECESCLLRERGFADAGVPDPAVVKESERMGVK